MKNFLKRVPKSVYAGVVALALVAGVASQVLAGFGPNRPTRPWTPAENGFEYVTFNSFTGVPNGIGDEREFLKGVQVGRDGTWSDPVNGVEQGAEVEMKIYIHNNADPLLNDQPGNPGVAKNVNVKAVLPTGSAQSQQTTAYISASNAQPTQVFDTLDMTGANSGYFELAYVPGSAKMFDHENGQTSALSDSLVTTGVNIGDQKGCFKYVREVTFRVKVNMPRYQTQKTVRNFGEDSTKWRKVANTKIGDKVEWRIWFANSGKTRLNGVKIVDDLPPYVTVVPGSIKLYKGQNSMTVADTAIQKNGTQININAGDYLPGDDSYLVFATTINNDKKISCGAQQLANVAYTTPDGYGAINDSARVNVLNEKPCDDNKPSYVCESLSVEKLGGRKIRSTVKAPASNGAVVKVVTFNYGDGSTPKVTDKLVDEYEFKADGTYKITATVTFTVNGTDKQVTSEDCTSMVTFEGGKPVTPPVTPASSLPKTGAGSVIGIVTAVTVAGAVAHNVFSRRSVR